MTTRSEEEVEVLRLECEVRYWRDWVRKNGGPRSQAWALAKERIRGHRGTAGLSALLEALNSNAG